MRRRAILILGLALTVWSGCAALAAGELLSNPDFEAWSGGVPIGWTTEAAVLVTQEVATVRAGAASLGLATTGTADRGIYQQVPVQPDWPYELTCWIWADNVALAGSEIHINWRDPTGADLGSSWPRYSALPGIWELVSTGPVVSPSAAAYARVYLRQSEDGPGCTPDFFDDASLQEVSLDQVDASFSSEWDATAYNGGRRMVRDSDGFMHFVFHSQFDPSAQPGNPVLAPRPAGIYYTHTLRPVEDLPPPLTSGDWAPPMEVAGTGMEDFLDDRHPSIGIEYDPTAPHNAQDRIHVVWQRESGPGAPYDIAYSTRPNEPAPPPDPTGWEQTPGGVPGWRWLWQSAWENRDSLVPVIDVSNNFVHVAWQEEDWEPFGGPAPYHSEILYKVSWSASWLNPLAFDHVISNSIGTNSQVPSIAVNHDDRYTTNYQYPQNGMGGQGPYTVWIVWNDDFVTVGLPPHIWMAKSTDNGATWDTGGGITGGTELSALAGTNQDGYPCIAVDPWMAPGGADHVVWMTWVLPHDPDSSMQLGRGTPPQSYDPGVHPWNPFSHPGPDPGMYALVPNYVVYSSLTLGIPGMPISQSVDRDAEFPTISSQGQGAGPGDQRLWVNYMGWQNEDYEIYQDSCTLDPAALAGNLWWGPMHGTDDESISRDPANDDLFPNLAFKKTAMYWPAGRELGWLKVEGHHAEAAVMPAPKPLFFSSSSEWENTLPDFTTWHVPTNWEPPGIGVQMRQPLAPTALTPQVDLYVGGWAAPVIWGGTAFYRKMSPNAGAVWSAAALVWHSTPSSNEYFQASFPVAGSFVAGDVVEYYFAVYTNPATGSVQYLYGDDNLSLTSRMEVVAQGSPYRFTISGGATATPTPTVTSSPSRTPTLTPTDGPGTSTPTRTPTPTATPTSTPDDCDTCPGVPIGIGVPVFGDTCTNTHMYSGSCSMGTNIAPDCVYHLNLAEPLCDVQICLVGDYDTVLYMRQDVCPDPLMEIGCDDDTYCAPVLCPPAPFHSFLFFPILPPGDYYIFVDGTHLHGFPNCGPYCLEILGNPCPPTATPSATVTPTPTDTPTGPTATPTALPPVPATGPAGLVLLIGLASLALRRRRS